MHLAKLQRHSKRERNRYQELVTRWRLLRQRPDDRGIAFNRMIAPRHVTSFKRYGSQVVSRHFVSKACDLLQLAFDFVQLACPSRPQSTGATTEKWLNITGRSEPTEPPAITTFCVASCRTSLRSVRPIQKKPHSQMRMGLSRFPDKQVDYWFNCSSIDSLDALVPSAPHKPYGLFLPAPCTP